MRIRERFANQYVNFSFFLDVLANFHPMCVLLFSRIHFLRCILRNWSIRRTQRCSNDRNRALRCLDASVRVFVLGLSGLRVRTFIHLAPLSKARGMKRAILNSGPYFKALMEFGNIIFRISICAIVSVPLCQPQIAKHMPPRLRYSLFKETTVVYDISLSTVVAIYIFSGHKETWRLKRPCILINCHGIGTSVIEFAFIYNFIIEWHGSHYFSQINLSNKSMNHKICCFVASYSIMFL